MILFLMGFLNQLHFAYVWSRSLRKELSLFTGRRRFPSGGHRGCAVILVLDFNVAGVTEDRGGGILGLLHFAGPGGGTGLELLLRASLRDSLTSPGPLAFGLFKHGIIAHGTVVK